MRNPELETELWDSINELSKEDTERLIAFIIALQNDDTETVERMWAEGRAAKEVDCA